MSEQSDTISRIDEQSQTTGRIDEQSETISRIDEQRAGVAGAPPERFRLGVLFVHGIGQQARGQTLVEMGEPIARWLRRWITADHTDETEIAGYGTAVSIDRAVIVVGGASPSHVILTVGSHEPPIRWLLAEAWWAESFHPARFGDLGRWGLIIGPWMVASHLYLVGHRVRLSRRAIMKAWERHPMDAAVLLIVWAVGGLIGLAILIATAIISIALELFAFALLIVAFLPIPWLRGAILNFQRGLANGLGDSYVLVRSPFQFAAMAETVRREATWLADRCDKVAVVAHSQGAAVAFEALRYPEKRPRNLSQLVTFGQGLRKLRALRTLDAQAYRESAPWFWWLTAATAVAVLFAVLISPDALCEVVSCANRVPGGVGKVLTDASKGMLVAGGPSDTADVVASFAAQVVSTWPLATAFVAAIAVICALQFGIAQSAKHREAEVERELGRELEDMGLGSAFQWTDIYASADPVPNGPLFQDEVEGKLEMHRVRNEGSTMLDHTSYWGNATQFVSLVALRLAEAAGMPLSRLRGGDPSRITDAAERRERRVELLTIVRIIAGVGWIVIVASQGFALDERAAVLLSVVTTSLLPFVSVDATTWPPAVLAVLGAAFYAALAFAWYVLARLIWGVVVNEDERRFFQRHAVNDTPIAWIALVIWMTMGFLAVIGGTLYLANAWWTGAFLVAMALLVYVFQFYLREASRQSDVAAEGVPVSSL
jgi:hypothetical protein